jgi:hypothetical protein
MRFLILGKWETTCTLSHESANVIMCCATSEVRYLPCVSDSLNHSPRLYLRWHNIYIYRKQEYMLQTGCMHILHVSPLDQIKKHNHSH